MEKRTEPISQEDMAWLNVKLKRAKTDRQKGDIVEALGINSLERLGWNVWKPPRAKFHSQDIWGIGDVTCIHPQMPFLYLVQFSLGKAQTDHVIALTKFTDKFRIPTQSPENGLLVEYWILKIPKKKQPYWEIRRY